MRLPDCQAASEVKSSCEQIAVFYPCQTQPLSTLGTLKTKGGKLKVSFVGSREASQAVI